MGQTYQSIVISAPVEKVWDKISNFHDLSWAAGVAEKVVVVGDKAGDQIGAKRVLNDAFHETLLEVSSIGRTIKYSIDDGPSPVSKDEVSDYVGAIRMSPITEGDGGTFVEWSSSWQGNEDACGEFCHGIYVALLAALKSSLS